MTKQETVEIELPELIDQAGFAPEAAIAMIVVHGDGAQTRYARGVLADGQAMSTDTLVYGASQTKQIVALCAARLVREGRLDPDSPIARWFPDWPAWAQRVRFRHLIHHRSGMPDEKTLLGRMRELGYEGRTSDAMLAAVATFPTLAAEPGERHEYSNIGYVTMGRVIESITGSPLPQHVDEVVFAPLGMSHSLLWKGPEPHPAGAAPLDPEYPTPLSLGDGGMWTTAADFVKWIEAMNADRFGVHSLMTQTMSLNDGTPQDYAWAIRVSTENGTQVCSHGGAWWGSYSKSAWMPAIGTGFIVFATEGDEPLESLGRSLIERLTEW
jgi:CubicO group peptidase (beta-lactamase class C family)